MVGQSESTHPAPPLNQSLLDSSVYTFTVHLSAYVLGAAPQSALSCARGIIIYSQQNPAV